MCKFHLYPQSNIFHWGSTVLGVSKLCIRYRMCDSHYGLIFIMPGRSEDSSELLSNLTVWFWDNTVYEKYENAANAHGVRRFEQSHQCWLENELLSMCWTIGNGIWNNRYISHIPKCPCHMSHNAPFFKKKCVHMWTFLWNVGELWNICLVRCGICKTGCAIRVLSTSKCPEHHDLRTCT